MRGIEKTAGRGTWRYSIGMLGTSLPINMVRGSIALYYVDILGLNTAAYAVVMVLYGVLDAIDNPVLGHLSDRTRTRFGRRRPWIFVGTIILAAALVGFFSGQSLGGGIGLVLWFAFFAILCEAADSMVSANYSALLPELYTEERARARANSLRQAFQLLALVITLAITPLLTTKVFGTDSTPEGFTITAVIYAAIGASVLLFMVSQVREQRLPDLAKPPAFFSSLKHIIRVPLFWKVGFASACYLVPLGIVLAALQLYVKYALRLPVSRTVVIMGAVLVVAGVALWTWTMVVNKVGAPRVWRASFWFLAGGFAPLYFVNSLAGATAAACVIAVGWAGLLATNDLVQSRILDHDARTTGLHREGIFLSAFGFFGRLTGALSGVAFWLITQLYGYNNQVNPGPNPGEAFRFVTSVIPFVIALIGLVLVRFIEVPDAGRTYFDDGEDDAPAR